MLVLPEAADAPLMCLRLALKSGHDSSAGTGKAAHLERQGGFSSGQVEQVLLLQRLQRHLLSLLELLVELPQVDGHKSGDASAHACSNNRGQISRSSSNVKA